jgi:hypothetical protein
MNQVKQFAVLPRLDAEAMACPVVLVGTSIHGFLPDRRWNFPRPPQKHPRSILVAGACRLAVSCPVPAATCHSDSPRPCRPVSSRGSTPKSNHHAAVRQVPRGTCTGTLTCLDHTLSARLLPSSPPGLVSPASIFLQDLSPPFTASARKYACFPSIRPCPPASCRGIGKACS